MERNRVKNPSMQKEKQLTIYKHAWVRVGLEHRITRLQGRHSNHSTTLLPIVLYK